MSAARFVLALLLSAAGFAAIWGATWAAGYGRDLHLLRVLAVVGILFITALLFVRPNRTREIRVFALAAAFILGAFAWWSVPSRAGGLNLYTAASKRDAIILQLGVVYFDDIRSAGQWRNSIDDLEREYPTLSSTLHPEFARWGRDASEAVQERLREIPPGAIVTAGDAYARGIELSQAFPQTRGSIDEAYRSWGRRSALALIDELRTLPPESWDDFNRTAAARQRQAVAFPDSREEMTRAEVDWVRSSAGAATEAALRERESHPEQVRKTCRDVETRIRGLHSLAPRITQFHATRSALFRFAHDAAGREVLEHLRQKQYDRAFDVALQHGFEWTAAVKSLGSEESTALTELREHARHLAIRFEKAGIVDLAPEPRGRETAPSPRPRADATRMGSPAFAISLSLYISDEPPDSATERKQLEEALAYVRDRKYVFAVARLAPFAKNTALPAPIAKAIPGLINDLRVLDAVTQLAEATPNEKVPALGSELLPDSVKRPLLWLELLRGVGDLLEMRLPASADLPWGMEQAEKLLAAVAADFDAESASRLRVELSAKLFLLGRPGDATKLLEREGPGEHARRVLDDLRTIVIGSGTLTNPQVARFVPENGLAEMPGARALMPAALRGNWQRPEPPAETETTLATLAKRTIADTIQLAKKERARLSQKVDESAAAIRMELAKP
jgi:hypothetical protein